MKPDRRDYAGQIRPPEDSGGAAFYGFAFQEFGGLYRVLNIQVPKYITLEKIQTRQREAKSRTIQGAKYITLEKDPDKAERSQIKDYTGC